MTVAIPKLRTGSFFPSILEPRRRIDQALYGVVMEAYVKKGWTTVLARSSGMDKVREEHRISVEMAWTKQDLLSTRRGFAYPQLALVVNPDRWQGDERSVIVEATRSVARDLGMTRKDSWWAHWGSLDPIAQTQTVEAYADECVATLSLAAERFRPAVLEALAALPTG